MTSARARYAQGLVLCDASENDGAVVTDLDPLTLILSLRERELGATQFGIRKGPAASPLGSRA